MLNKTRYLNTIMVVISFNNNNNNDNNNNNNQFINPLVPKGSPFDE